MPQIHYALRRLCHSVGVAIMVLSVTAASSFAQVKGTTNQLQYVRKTTPMYSLTDPFGFQVTTNLLLQSSTHSNAIEGLRIYINTLSNSLILVDGSLASETNRALAAEAAIAARVDSVTNGAALALTALQPLATNLLGTALQPGATNALALLYGPRLSSLEGLTNSVVYASATNGWTVSAHQDWLLASATNGWTVAAHQNWVLAADVYDMVAYAVSAAVASIPGLTNSVAGAVDAYFAGTNISASVVTPDRLQTWYGTNSAFTSDGLLYAANATGLSVTNYTGTNAYVAIPPYYRGAPVTAVGEGAFYGKTNVISVILPPTLTDIAAFAFGVTGITAVDIPDSVFTVGAYAFYECDALLSITFRNTAGYFGIGDHAFQGCGAVAEVVFHGNLPPYGAMFGNADAFSGFSGPCVVEVRYGALLHIGAPVGSTFAGYPVRLFGPATVAAISFNGASSAMSEYGTVALVEADPSVANVSNMVVAVSNDVAQSLSALSSTNALLTAAITNEAALRLAADAASTQSIASILSTLPSLSEGLTNEAAFRAALSNDVARSLAALETNRVTVLWTGSNTFVTGDATGTNLDLWGVTESTGAIIVTGAGEESANGTYLPTGNTGTNVPLYTNVLGTAEIAISAIGFAYINIGIGEYYGDGPAPFVWTGAAAIAPPLPTSYFAPVTNHIARIATTNDIAAISLTQTETWWDDTGIYDAVNAAGDVVQAHVNLPDPHTQYLLKTNAAAIGASPFTAFTGIVTPALGTATVTAAHGNMPTIAIAEPTVILLDPTGFSTNGVCRISVNFFSGTNTITLATNHVIYATVPTLSTNMPNSLLWRRVSDGVWKGVVF